MYSLSSVEERLELTKLTPEEARIMSVQFGKKVMPLSTPHTAMWANVSIEQVMAIHKKCLNSL
jgi:hypothetical protein